MVPVLGLPFPTSGEGKWLLMKHGCQGQPKGIRISVPHSHTLLH